MSNRLLLACFSFFVLACSASYAQDLPLQTQISRIKANRAHFAERYPDLTMNVDLKAKVAKTGQDAFVDVLVSDGPGCEECSKTPEDNPAIRQAAMESDLVISGTVVNKLSALSQSNTFTLTDVDVRVNEVIKGAVSPSNLEDGGNLDLITVTMPGGWVKSQGHTIEASDGNLRAMTIGHSYVLFLNYLPETHSYRLSPFDPGYDLTSEKAQTLSANGSPANRTLLENKSSWLAALRSSIEKEKASPGVRN